VHREADDTLHWMIGDVAPPELQLALDADDECLARERERIWYVACTRARELLIVPQQSAAAQNSWARVVDLAGVELPALDLSKLDPVGFSLPAESPNLQTAEMFASERAAITAAATPITWLTPSDQDQDRMPVEQAVAADVGEVPEREIPIGAGRMRGLVLHKLMEEVLTGELAEDLSAFVRRARELLVELPIDSSDEAVFPAAEKMGSTAWKTLHLAEIAALRPELVPELPLYAMLDNEVGAMALAGRADAIAFDKGQASVVLDWKSDVASDEPGHADPRRSASGLHNSDRRASWRRGLYDIGIGALGRVASQRDIGATVRFLLVAENRTIDCADARSFALCRVMSSPSNTIWPADGARKPLIMLKNVVLPAPFGPITARSSPASTVIDTRSTATRLPKRRDTFSTRSRLMARRAVGRCRGPRAGRTARSRQRRGR
jgi:hypothetical protein